MAFLTAMVMVLGCVAMNVYADVNSEAAAKWTADNKDTVLDLQSSKSGREYTAYQLFYGTKSGEILSDLKWGANVTDSTAIVKYLKADTVNDRTNTVKSYFADMAENASAEDVATVFIKANNESTDNADMLAYILIYAMKQQSGTTTKTSTQETGGSDTTGYTYTFGAVHTGYYLVEETSSSIKDKETYSKYMAKVVGPTTIVTKEKSGPTIEKKIVTQEATPEGTTEGLADEEGVGIDDTVRFKLSSKVPNMDGYNKYFFIMQDVLSEALTYNADKANMKVTIGSTELKEGNDYYIVLSDPDEKDGSVTMKIVFKDFLKYKSQEDDPIVVYYSATVNDNIVPGNVQDNSNKVQIIYSNNPTVNYKGYNSQDPNDPDGDEPDPNNETDKKYITSSEWDIVYVYTGAVEIIKVDSENKRLEGATFRVTPKSGSTPVKKVVKVRNIYTPVKYYREAADLTSDANDLYVKSPTGTYSQSADSNKETVYVMYEQTEDGSYKENVNGEYYHEADTTTYVKEMDTSKTYEQASIVYQLDVKEETEDVATNAEWYGTVGSDGVLRIVGLPEGTYDITEVTPPAGYNSLNHNISMKVEFTYSNSTPNWKYYFDDNGGTAYTAGSTTANLAGVGVKTIENKIGSTLPSTGGMGTKLFYLIGSILLIAASVLLISKRRMNNNWD
jgi:LPXTG-motif cell wall-anchored protein